MPITHKASRAVDSAARTSQQKQKITQPKNHQQQKKTSKNRQSLVRDGPKQEITEMELSKQQESLMQLVERQQPTEEPEQLESCQRTYALRLRLLLLAAVVSTFVGFCLVAALLLHYRGPHSLQLQLPPNVSIPARQLASYDNGSFTSNWWRLDLCIRRLHCPPDFFACQAASTLASGDNPESTQPGAPLYLWHHFLLLGWALFTCHQAVGMRQLFLAQGGGSSSG